MSLAKVLVFAPSEVVLVPVEETITNKEEVIATYLKENHYPEYELEDLVLLPAGKGFRLVIEEPLFVF